MKVKVIGEIAFNTLLASVYLEAAFVIKLLILMKNPVITPLIAE